MVAYNPPKAARRAKRGRAGPATLDDLPDELLLEIYGYLAGKDVFNMRAICRATLRTGNTTIHSRFRTLYLHPTTTSFRQLQRICAYPVISQSIEELIILGRPTIMWPEIRKAQRISRNDFRRESDRFKPWPPALSECGDDIVHDDDLEQPKPKKLARHLPFDDAYAPMIKAVSNLPRLHKLVFAEDVCAENWADSFMPVRQCAINANAWSWSAPRHIPFATEQAVGSKKRYSVRERPERRTDAEIRWSILASDQLDFKSFRIECELPMMERTAYDLIPSTLLEPVRPSLRELLLTIESWRGEYGWDHTINTYQRLVRQNRFSLVRMSVLVHHGLKTSPYIIEHILGNDLCLPILEVLVIDHRAPAPVVHRLCCKQVETVSLHSGKAAKAHKKAEARPEPRLTRPRRPLSQRFGFPNFFVPEWMSTTSPAIQKLTVRNVWIEHSDDDQHMLQQLARLESLKLMEWTVPRYRHNECCKEPDTKEPLCEKWGGCGVYASHVRVETFERLAAAIGVDLDEEKQCWDFGKYVMRVKK